MNKKNQPRVLKAIRSKINLKTQEKSII